MAKLYVLFRITLFFIPKICTYQKKAVPLQAISETTLGRKEIDGAE